MGTRSNIGILNEDGTFEVIYCHWDGYVAHNGKILLESYTKVSKIRKLISLGDISILAHNIGKKTDFDNRDGDQVIAYGRDRGEENVEALIYPNLDEYFEYVDDAIEYVYVFDVKAKKWMYTADDRPELSELII